MQNHDSLNSMLSDIRSALMRGEGEAKTGSQIHQIILDAAPGIDVRSIVGIPVGPGALTKFIETYFQGTVNRIGMQGGDVLYGIGDVVRAAPKIENTSIWKAFVSPSAVKFLCLRTSDMKLLVLDHLDLDDDTHHIARVSGAEHDKIREDFRSSLTESQRAMLDQNVATDSSYDTFVAALRLDGLMKSWGLFRRDAFAELFAARLKAIPVNDELISGITAQLLESQQALFKEEASKPATAQSSISGRSLEPANAARRDNLEAAKSLAKSVIDKMTYDELRGIHVPFGAVLDALSRK